MKFSLVVLAAAALFAQPAGTSKEPQFSDYPAQVLANRASVPPKLGTPGQRRFRTMIRDAAAKGPNFAGHFALAEWGCGAACVQMAVIDTISGQVYDGPFGILPRGTISFPAEENTGLFYHPDSSLLIARGCPNETDCGAYYYLWTGKQFKLLRKSN